VLRRAGGRARGALGGARRLGLDQRQPEGDRYGGKRRGGNNTDNRAPVHESPA
jgi:hypothetical protein